MSNKKIALIVALIFTSIISTIVGYFVLPIKMTLIVPLTNVIRIECRSYMITGESGQYDVKVTFEGDELDRVIKRLDKVFYQNAVDYVKTLGALSVSIYYSDGARGGFSGTGGGYTNAGGVRHNYPIRLLNATQLHDYIFADYINSNS